MAMDNISRIAYLNDDITRSRDAAQAEFDASLSEHGFAYTFEWHAERALVADHTFRIWHGWYIAYTAERLTADEFFPKVTAALTRDLILGTRFSHSTSPTDNLSEKAKLTAIAKLLDKIATY